MSWFPIPEWLLYGNPDWHQLTVTAKLMMLCCISEANLRQGPFYRSHADWAVRLKVSFRTVPRTQEKLVKLGWIAVAPGYHRSRGLGIASLYTVMLPAEEGAHWGQVPRFMFEWILHKRDADAALTYTYLSLEYHRHRGRYKDRGLFYVFLGELQRESGLRDFHSQIQRLYDGFQFKDKSHLFEWTGFRKLEFTKWIVGSEEENPAIHVEREHEIATQAQELMKARTMPKKKKRNAKGVGR